MSFFNLPVAKRTRHQRLLYAQGLLINGIGDSWSCGSSRNQDRKQNIEIVSSKSEDDYEVIEIGDDENNHNNGFNGAGRTKRRLDEVIKVEISSSDESEEENGDENGSGDTSTSKSDESSSDESNEDGSDGEGSGDPSKSVNVKKQV